MIILRGLLGFRFPTLYDSNGREEKERQEEKKKKKKREINKLGIFERRE